MVDDLVLTSAILKFRVNVLLLGFRRVNATIALISGSVDIKNII